MNPLAITRDAWRDVAAKASAASIDVEVVCSDEAEHRHRVEARTADLTGHVQPTWRDVVERDYEPWHRPRIVIDTAGRTVAAALQDLRSKLDAAG